MATRTLDSSGKDYLGQEQSGGPNPLTGPFYVEGAEPGDVLEVQILDVKMAVPYSYNAMGAAGGLADEF